MVIMLPLLGIIRDRVVALKEATGAVPPEEQALLDEVKRWMAAGPGSHPTDGAQLRAASSAALPALDARSDWTTLLRVTLVARLRDFVDLRGDCCRLWAAIVAGERRLPEGLHRTGEPMTESPPPPRSRHRGPLRPRRDRRCPRLLPHLDQHELGRRRDGGADGGGRPQPDGDPGQPRAGADALHLRCACGDGDRVRLPVPDLSERRRLSRARRRARAGLHHRRRLHDPADDRPDGARDHREYRVLLGIQDRYSADVATFFNGNIAAIGGFVIAVIVLSLMRTIGAEQAGRRLLSAAWRDVADAAGRANPRPRLFAPAHDRPARPPGAAPRPRPVARPRQRAGDGGHHDGVATIDLRAAVTALPLPARDDVDRLAGALQAYYARRADDPTGEIPPPPVTEIDTALQDLLGLPEGLARRNAVYALVALRRGLYPAAAPYRAAIPPAPLSAPRPVEVPA